MAKTKWRGAVVLVGTADPPTQALNNKKDVKPDGPKQVRDDTTTDDSALPEHEVIFTNLISQLETEVIADEADASWVILRDAARAGTKIWVIWRPYGTGSTKETNKFQATVDLKPVGSSAGMARYTVTLMVTGAITTTAQ